MGVVVITDEGSTPSTPADGSAVFSAAGKLKYRSDSGTVHEIVTDNNAVLASGVVTNTMLATDIKVGSLASLTTTENASVVGAINEVDANADAAAALVGTLASLTTDTKSSVVAAINEVDANINTEIATVTADIIALDARVDVIVAGTGDDIVEVVDARDGETVLGDRLDGMDDALQTVALRLTATAAVAATSITVKHWPAAIAHGVWLVIDPFTADCEVRRVTSVSGETISFASALQYEHAAGDVVLLSFVGEINALWFGASPSASAATNGVAFTRMVAQAQRADNPAKMYIPGASDPYEFDTTIVLAGTGAIYGLAIRGDGMARRGEIYTHGTVLFYTPTDATNAIEIGNGTHACRNLSLSNLTLRCDRAGGHTGIGIYARYTGYTSDMLCNVAVTQAYVGIRTVDCWGSTWRNVDVSFCYLGASINGMNGGAWVGGGARLCYGEAAIKFGEASTEVANHLISFNLQSIVCEGNTGDGIWFTGNSAIATAINYYSLTIDNCYFEANGGTYSIQFCGVAGGSSIAFSGVTMRNCFLEENVLIGRNARNFVFGPNRFGDTMGYYLESASGTSNGIFVGTTPSTIKSALNSYVGSTYSLLFVSSTGYASLGIASIASSYNPSSLLNTARLLSIAITAATADWRSLSGATLLSINHASPTNFTEITNCPDHTLLLLRFVTANTTVVHNASKIVLRGAANYAPAANEILTVISISGVLYEVSRTAA